MHIEQTLQKMRQLRLTTMANSLEQRIAKGDHRDMDPETLISHLVDDEVEARASKQINRLIKRAKLRPEQACLENINYTGKRGFSKKDLERFYRIDWIERAENMIFNGATTGQVIEVYDTQLEGGSQATPFEHRSYGQELALCQRYYEDIWVNGVAMNAYGGTASAYGFTLFKVQKRTSPTMVYYTDIPNYGCHRHTGAENAGLFWNNVGSRPDGVSFRYARGAGNWPSDADCVHAYCHKSADAEL